MTEIEYGHSRILIERLDSRGREAERLAVARLVRAAFGEDVVLEHRPDGSPVISVPGIEISVSHCATCAAIAISYRHIGIDVETDRPQLSRVAPRVLSPAEIDFYSDNLVGAWTMKEALYKAALTPGLDFRRDICLPLDGSDTATVLTPGPVSFRIAASCRLDDYGCFISLAEAL